MAPMEAGEPRSCILEDRRPSPSPSDLPARYPQLPMRYTTQFLLSALAAAQFPRAGRAGDRLSGPLQRGQIEPAEHAGRRKGGAKFRRRRDARGPSTFLRCWTRASRTKLIFADLPGYGYAKISKSISASWPAFIEPYLAIRSTLKLCVCLVDSNVPAQQSDRQLIDWLRAAGRDFAVVATKIDRLSGNQRTRNLLALKQGPGVGRASARLGQNRLRREGTLGADRGGGQLVASAARSAFRTFGT